ncbi:uncharacterized protein LOC127102140 [Lathyrus oleraceus]|uniref:uncharacterized protein LOC127102140 n=1 Tax=Pisum sativum TaxID=3888 RepID=UPI0021D00049|nr:uncharacterized protein LOC127102140 [Pisum sativum]
MLKQSSPKHMHVSIETSGSSSPTSREDEPFQMINLSDLVLDVAPLSTIHPPSQKKATPSAFEPIIPSKDKTVVEEGSRFKGSEMRNPTKRTGVTENQTEAGRIAIDKELRKFVTSILKEVDSHVLPDVQTSLERETSPDGNSSEKVEECVPEQAAHERRSKKKADECVPEEVSHGRRSKKKVDFVVNIDDLTTDEEPLTNILAPGIAKKLQRRKGKAVISWSEVVTPTRKRKVVSSSDSEFEVEKDVQDITPKYVIQRRIALERELGKDALKCKEVVELIEAIGLMKIVTKFRLCYESLVKEFVVTIPDGCDDVKSANYRKGLMEEEEKEAEHGGDDNVGVDVEDSAGVNDAETDEDKKAK